MRKIILLTEESFIRLLECHQRKGIFIVTHTNLPCGRVAVWILI